MALTPWIEKTERVYPNCWYKPVSDPEEVALALRFTLSQDVTAALAPGDDRLLRSALTAVYLLVSRRGDRGSSVSRCRAGTDLPARKGLGARG